MAEYPYYDVVLQRVADGETRVYHDEIPWNGEDGSWFWWSEGNMGCDCNRHLCFERAGGRKPEWHKGECSNGRYRVLEFRFPDGSVKAGPDAE